MSWLYQATLDVAGGIDENCTTPAQLESFVRKHQPEIEELFGVHYPNTDKNRWEQVGYLEVHEVAEVACIPDALPDEDDWKRMSRLETYYIHLHPEGRLIMFEPQGGRAWTRVDSDIKDLLNSDYCWIIEL